MIYVIMCGGVYDAFATPKQLTVVGGETLVDRTIRLLHESGVQDICITATDKRFDGHGAPRLEHKNSFCVKDGSLEGYWLDAFYPDFPDGTEVCFLFGDVCFTENAIRTIVEADVKENTLVGNSVAKNKEHRNIGEPFAYIVKDYRTFMEGVQAVKKLYDDGMLLRHPIVWELYRYLNRLDVNVQQILDRTYIAIDDGTIDIDAPWQEAELNEKCLLF